MRAVLLSRGATDMHPSKASSCTCASANAHIQRLEAWAHLDSNVLGATAGIDSGVVVQVVPGPSREVGLCGIGALVYDGRD
jgi:hypothetical protein